MIDRALVDDEFVRKLNVQVKEYGALLRFSGGDARKLYNGLELAAEEAHALSVPITDELVGRVIHHNLSRYDKGGEQHYDIVSAMIKSIRGSDPNAALYWLARMLEGGEDLQFITRRLIISASEDIGLANPNALLMATTCRDAVSTLGMPEGRIVLGQTVVYLATSPKSNASYAAMDAALAAVRKSGDLPVPLHLRNAPTRLMKDLGYGTNYAYAHAHAGNFVAQEYMPEGLKDQVFYLPGQNASEAAIRQRLEAWWPKLYPTAPKPQP